MEEKKASILELRNMVEALTCCSHNRGYGCEKECAFFHREYCMEELFTASAEAITELIERREAEKEEGER